MPAPEFHPRQSGPAGESSPDLFDTILERVHRDLPDAVGLAVTVHDRRHDDSVAVLASHGVGREFIAAQLAVGHGPVLDAVAHQVPVLSPDLDGDDRWPGLTSAALAGRFAGEEALWRRVKGAAAVPGIWHSDETVVLTCVLDTAARAATVTTLIGYEQLIAAGMLAAAARAGTELADMMAVLQSRGAIEQAKGIVMGMLRCDADSAWATLRRASHESNVKLRVLAVALVEHIGGAPAEQPAAGAPIVPDEAARKAAQLLWAVLTHAPEAVSRPG